MFCAKRTEMHQAIWSSQPHHVLKKSGHYPQVNKQDLRILSGKVKKTQVLDC